MHTFIKNLLNGQAVEWRTLGEVVLPTNNIKWHESDLSYRYIDLSSVNKDNNNIGETLEITSKNAPSRAQKIVKKDDIIFATTRPTQMRSALIPPNLDGQIASTGYCILRANQNEVLPKWIYYNLQINEFKIYLQDKQSGTAYPAISDGLIKQFQIPIPPLSVQSQIVQILDAFTELNDQLTTELSMRQKQYQYYRDFLLSEHELAKVGFEWKTLGKLGIINRGKRVVKSQLTTEGVYPVYQNSLQPLGYFDKSNVKANTTFMITAGAAGEIGYSNCAFWSADDCYYFDCPKDVLDDRFLYHSLKKQQNKIFSQVRKASIPRLGRNSVENIKIPIPPLSVQNQIVAILDKFDHLTSSITDGLPKEIELRRKQYEHYRELLLGFDN